MSDIRTKYVPPAINELSFNCPHCGALAQQFWFTLHADKIGKDKTPLRIDADKLEKLDLDHIRDVQERRELQLWAKRMAEERPFISPKSQYRGYDLGNVSLSRCFGCNDVAIWIYDRLIWPGLGQAPLPNPDLPDDVRRDYEEASTILDLSPRGAAALLRLVIQKLCKQAGEKGKDIDKDIASLVKKGLDLRVQQALDVVRVIGNNAVHPGQIDLEDDRATAEELFSLVNLITDIMISQPKHIKQMYDKLPEGARTAIEKRDGKE